MRHGQRFSDLLDDKLHGFAPEPAPARPAVFRAAPILGFFTLDATGTAGPIKYVQQGSGFGLRASGFAAGVDSGFGVRDSRAAATVETAPPPARRVKRTLAPAEARALANLVALGAALDDSFTDDELRRAFRTLAFRYHPDRHPQASVAERARLATQFAQAHAAYDELR